MPRFLRQQGFTICKDAWLTMCRDQQAKGRQDGAVFGNGAMTLPLALQLALNYSPDALRPMYSSFFQLDAMFDRVVTSATEPMLAQIRLAWWREGLNRDGTTGADQTPLMLEAHHSWGSPALPLVDLVDGWGRLVAGALDSETADAFCNGREAVAAAVAERAGLKIFTDAVRCSARRWSLADLLHRGANTEERDCIRAELRRMPTAAARARLPAELRPFAVLDALGRRAIAKGGTNLADGRGSVAVAMRAGLLGR